MKRLRTTLARLHGDEEGASLVFAAITMMTLTFSIMVVFRLGLLSGNRLQMQTAADAAAYSGALVEAESLNAIGQINDGMAYLHYHLLRYTVDNIVYETLNEFSDHHNWVRQNRSNLISANPQPTYDFLPSTPGVTAPAENTEAPPFVMIGDADEWQDRYEKVRAIQSNGLIEKGKRWMLDLHQAGRLIMATTPRRVREMAARIAYLNGASHVAVSEDLELAFTLGDDGSGFRDYLEGREAEDNQATPASVLRYASRTLAVDNKPRSFPRWFDPMRGKMPDPRYYGAVRLCWNTNDWKHRRSSPTQHQGFPYSSGPPNGHWHARHNHYITDPATGIPMPTPHGDVDLGGHEEDDAQLHQMDSFGLGAIHHSLMICPTCGARSYEGNWTEIGKFGDDVDQSKRDRLFALEFDGTYPRPLALRQQVLRSGVTVATWYRGDGGITDLFPNPEWGVLAVASAQIGVRRDYGVELLIQADENFGYYLDYNERLPSADANDDADPTPPPIADNPSANDEALTLIGLANYDPNAGEPRYNNFFYSTNHQDGYAFGARLVPSGSRREQLTFHPDLEDGRALDALFNPQSGGSSPRWYVAAEGATGQRPEIPDGLGTLSRWMVVNSRESMRRALWH